MILAIAKCKLFPLNINTIIYSTRACGNGSRNLENKYESVISFAAPVDGEMRRNHHEALVIDIYLNCVLRKFIT